MPVEKVMVRRLIKNNPILGKVGNRAIKNNFRALIVLNHYRKQQSAYLIGHSESWRGFCDRIEHLERPRIVAEFMARICEIAGLSLYRVGGPRSLIGLAEVVVLDPAQPK